MLRPPMAATVSCSSHDSFILSVCMAIWLSWTSASVGAPGGPDTGEHAVLDADVRLEHPEHGIDDDHVADDEIELRGGCGAIAHHQARPHGLAPPAEDLVAVARLVALDQREQVGVAE